MDTIGRKYALIASHIIDFFGYAMIAIARSVLVINFFIKFFCAYPTLK